MTVRRGQRLSLAYDMLRLPNARRALRYVLLVVLVLLIAPYVLAPFYAFGRPLSTVMLWRELTGQRVERDYVTLSSISPRLALAVLIAEDGRFCTHHGIDLAEMRTAISEADDLDDMRGGSTITQQVAKNLFLWPGRSYIRKALEIPLALWVDLVLSKRRILEIYLNIAEWGPDGQFGVEAGARYAFGTSARTCVALSGGAARRSAAQSCRPRCAQTRARIAAARPALCRALGALAGSRRLPRKIKVIRPPSLGRHHPL